MDYSYFQMYMLGFVNDIIGNLLVDSTRVQIAVISFSDKAQVWQRSGTSVYDDCSGGQLFSLQNRLKYLLENPYNWPILTERNIGVNKKHILYLILIAPYKLHCEQVA